LILHSPVLVVYAYQENFTGEQSDHIAGNPFIQFIHFSQFMICAAIRLSGIPNFAANMPMTIPNDGEAANKMLALCNTVDAIATGKRVTQRKDFTP